MPPSFPSQREAFAAVLYHASRRAAEEDVPEEGRLEEVRLENTIPETVASGTFVPDDIQSEDIGPKDISEGEERPSTVACPAWLQELIGSVAYNSDLSEEQIAGVEAAVAHFVFNR